MSTYGLTTVRDIWCGETHISVQPGDSPSSVMSAIALAARLEAERLNPPVHYVATHRVVNRWTDTCEDCRQSFVDIHFNRLRCVGRGTAGQRSSR